MSSPGNYLKNEREAKGITIADVADSTNINKKFLLAIENDANAQLPSHTITVGFLRAYSACIGIDSDKVVEKYNDHLAKLQIAAENISGQGNNNTLDSTNIKFLLTIAGSLLSVIVLVFAIVKISTTNTPLTVEDIDMDIPVKHTADAKKEELPRPAKPAAAQKKGPATLTLKPEKKREKLPAPDPGAESAVKEVPERALPVVVPAVPARTPPPEKTAHLNALPKKLKLRISAKERAWINVVIDGEVTKDVILPENQSLTWEAEESFLFSTGNIRGVTLQLNGMPLDLPEQTGRVLKRLLITGDNQKTVRSIQNQ